MRKLLFIIVFCFGFAKGFSQTAKDSLSVMEDKSTPLVERDLPTDWQRPYQGEEFYYEVQTGEAQNLLARFLNWLGSILQDTFGIQISPETYKVLEILIYCLMGGLIIALLVRVLVNEKFNSIFTKQAKSIIDIDLAEQHIESIDLDNLLNNALQQKEYRLAIRYQFLKVLKQLSEKGLIDWHFEKTNSDYMSEIEGETLKSNFRKATLIYDYVWYGERPINEQKYNQAVLRFTAFNNMAP